MVPHVRRILSFVQMDHMCVREAYRIWHGAPHLDDALRSLTVIIGMDGTKDLLTDNNKYVAGTH